MSRTSKRTAAGTCGTFRVLTAPTRYNQLLAAIAELKNLLLTAGHDLDALEFPLRLTIGSGESYIAPNGQETSVKPGDMFIADARGRILSAIITGPSAVARIGPETTAALFYAYAPPGVDLALVDAHLDQIERNVRFISPATVVAREIVTA